MKLFRVSLLFLFFATITSAQTISPVKAKSFNDAEVNLPAPGSQQVLSLITSFSHKSVDASKSAADGPSHLRGNTPAERRDTLQNWVVKSVSTQASTLHFEAFRRGYSY